MIHQHEHAWSKRDRRERLEFSSPDEADPADHCGREPTQPDRQHSVLPSRSHPHQRHDDQPLNHVGQ